MSQVKTLLQQFLSGAPKEDKKQLVVTLPAETVAQLDQAAEALSQQAGRPCSRNRLIAMGVEAVLADAQELLVRHALTKPATAKQRAAAQRRREVAASPAAQRKAVVSPPSAACDTVVLPANEEGFVQTFLGKQCWYYARLRADRVPALRYLALYVTKPYCHISHYAPVDRFEPVRDPVTGAKKYIVHLAGAPVALDRPVPLGGLNPAATRSPKYTTLDKLLAAATYADL